MTLPLWMLLAFGCWTLLVMVVLVGMRRWSLILAGRAALTSFPGDTPHGDPAYRRAVRARGRSPPRCRFASFVNLFISPPTPHCGCSVIDINPDGSREVRS